MDMNRLREKMVKSQIAARGIDDPDLLRAFREVPREAFVPEDIQEFAYEDSPLPISEHQTISQPFIVALMIEALELTPDSRVLDVGTGSGYAAALLSRILPRVYTIERIGSLVAVAVERFRQLGYDNIHVLEGDGSLGWETHAPYDAIVVAAGGPRVPDALKNQLADGGRLVIPVGDTPRLQTLLRIRRSGDEFNEEDLGEVRFVPLLGEEGWPDSGRKKAPVSTAATMTSFDEIRAQAEPFAAIDEASLDPLLERIGDARLVLLGEASHGTAEFYEMRARITRELIEKKGFNFVAVEADWPDAAAIDRYVRGMASTGSPEKFFQRFPRWMWANESVQAFVEWLRDYNTRFDRPDAAVGFHGMDMYSLYSSIDSVLAYLDRTDPASAQVARQRYGCLTPYAGDPAAYGASALTQRYRECEEEVATMLADILRKRTEYTEKDGWRFMDAVRNARLIASAERYYRVMYYGGHVSWNLRDEHMFDTLKQLLDFRGPDSRAVVWAHNSHLGDASATEMSARGETNVGQLCRAEFGSQAYLIGFGTDRGTVAAASAWDGPMEVKQVRPSHPGSYERLCLDSGIPSFLLPLTGTLGKVLTPARLERAIGVLYLPETELQSHYFQASLPRQFDEYIWFEESRAVTPLAPEVWTGMPDTWPFGL
ncbi:MAG: protein-L-isoaspartate(D-aspartate) O-methyltransferase [Thiogranum sp.]|nr:protein-L-isoaspartate(D-aspartate) O-methyltransferase [Thiogranum sp.]